MFRNPRSKGYLPLILKSIYYDSTRIRDRLLKILMYCDEFEITSLVIDIRDMQQLFEKFNPVVGKAFQEKSFMFNRSCENVELIKTKIFDPTDWKSGFSQDNTTTINVKPLEKSLDKLHRGFFEEMLRGCKFLLCKCCKGEKA